MSRPSSRAGGSLLKRVWLVAAILVAAGGWWGFVSLGRLLYHEDPLARGDVIFVLAGRKVERVAEAGDLYQQGWAPRILLSRQVSEGAEATFRTRGFDIPSEIDVQRSVLVQMGVPATAIQSLDTEQVATATESDQLFERATAGNWRAIIVVTSKLHTARARLAIRRRFDGTGVTIIMRGSRYDDANVDRWWTSRTDLRFVLFEVQKMVVYWVGIAD